MEKSIHVFMLILVLHDVLECALANHFSSFSLADECSLLFQFKENMSINNSASSYPRAYPKVASWNLNRSDGVRNCCLWDGVACNLGHVIRLDLRSSFLSGPISSNNSLFNLIHLHTLILADNNFHLSQIPSSIGNLKHLTIFDVSNCDFTGTLPASLSNLTHLNFLDLSGNKFIGSLTCLESFPNLTYVSLSGNNFDSWKLPDWFGKLNKIIFLFIYDVNLYGEISSSFFNLTQVAILDLSRNQLKGELSSTLLTFQNLEYSFSIDNNFTVDVYIFLSLKELRYPGLGENNITLSIIDSHTNETSLKFIELELASCNLKVFPEFLRFQHELLFLNLDNSNIEGLIPRCMRNISKETPIERSLSQNLLMDFEQHSPFTSWFRLNTLDLSHNMLTGEIAPWICDLLHLKFLDLSFNNITGSIPPCLEKLINSLVVLNLRSNTLQGTIPDIFTNGSNLHIIDLSENKLEGRIPRSLENCESLDFLVLRRNILQGTIPNIFTNESMLEMIDLSENKLEGQVPKSLKNCRSLQLLDLGHNSIEDVFPTWLGALPELQVLILRSNKFHGIIRIPSQIKVNFPKLHIIDLSYNSFSGDLPHQYFSEWSAMKETKANPTYIQFSIQMTNKGIKMVYVRIISTFSAIDFSNNMFRGEIPESIKTLTGLQLLNLSNNKLSGVIPPFMGNLISLESLDLSSNTLSGIIPQDLVQLNFLEVLNVSNNSLTGPIPQGKQFNTFSNNSYMANQALCGYPLSMKCGDSEALRSPKVSIEEATEYDFLNGTDWVVILFGVISGLVIGLVCGDYLTTRCYKWFLQRLRK